MSTETIAILRAILNQIEDCIEQAKETVEPKVISMEEERDWHSIPSPERMAYRQGPQQEDHKRRVVKYWPQLVPLATLHKRVQQYMGDVQGPRQ